MRSMACKPVNTGVSEAFQVLINSFPLNVRSSCRRIQSIQSMQDNLVESLMIGLLHTGKRGLDVVIHRLSVQGFAVVNRCVAIGDDDQIKEQSGDAPIELIEGMQSDQF